MRFVWGDSALKHFIITRFGYPDDYEYLEERLAIFNSFTLPSIKAQTNQNFEWLLLGEQLLDIPGARWFGNQPNEKLCPGHLNDSYLDYIKVATSKAKDELVLMTRFDNDDILLPSFVKDVQKIAKHHGIVDFRGYRLDLSKKNGPRWNNMFYKDVVYNETFTSPMITLVQTRVRQTVYRRNHALMAKFFPVTFVEKPNWVQLIHETNWLMATKQTRQYSERVANTHPFIVKLMEEYNATNC